jgi:aldehyde dehydrogenase (NAD+)
MTSFEILQRQRNYFAEHHTKPVKFRIEQLKKLKTLIIQNQNTLNEAIYKDFSKSPFETYSTEFAMLYSELNMAIKKVNRWSKPKRKMTNLANLPGKSFIIPEPFGNTLIIGAWNYPYQLTLLPMVTAMAAGNTAIVKPSEMAPHTSNAMAKLINDNFEPAYIHVVEGGVKETQELLDMRFDKIFFTGSVPVGKIIYKEAAKNMTPVTLELGGKSPSFVLSDADIKMTAKRIVWGKFLNAGQTCVATDYILVDKKVEIQLLEALKIEIQNQYPSFETLPENYVQIINERNFDRLTQLIVPEKIYFGGKHDRTRRLIQPTILNAIGFDDKVMEDEIFGPILPVIAYDDLNTVIKEVQNRERPLALYVFSKNKVDINRILQEISFGGGAINETVMHLTNHRLPFGGIGSSGIGNYHGYSGFQCFSHFKSMLKKSFLFEPGIKYSPYTEKKLKLMKKLLG